MHSTTLIYSDCFNDKPTDQRLSNMWNDLTEIPTEIQDGLNDVILYAESATEQNWTLPD